MSKMFAAILLVQIFMFVVPLCAIEHGDERRTYWEAFCLTTSIITGIVFAILDLGLILVAFLTLISA